MSETGAFTRISGDRGVDVGVASGDDALLGLSDQSSGSAVSGPGDATTVYDITDNTGAFSASDIGVTVSALIDQSGIETTTPPVQATVSGSGSQFSVAISCTTDTSSLGKSYHVVLEFDAESDGISISTTSTTNSYVSITCAYDYGDSNNYRDQESGDAVQPTDASGDIENPSAVNEKDDTTATAISAGGQEDLKVGYSLPPVAETATTYEMNFVVKSIQAGGGNFGFYLVDSTGQQLTDRQVLSTGDKMYSFTDAEEQNIAANYDDLYLIIDSSTTGKGNREMELDYFDLVSS